MKRAPEQLLTLAQIADQVGAPDTSTLRKDAERGVLKATKLGKTWIVTETEARRWAEKVWPKHVAERDKPIKTFPSPRDRPVKKARPTSGSRS